QVLVLRRQKILVGLQPDEDHRFARPAVGRQPDRQLGHALALVNRPDPSPAGAKTGGCYFFFAGLASATSGGAFLPSDLPSLPSDSCALAIFSATLVPVISPPTDFASIVFFSITRSRSATSSGLWSRRIWAVRAWAWGSG